MILERGSRIAPAFSRPVRGQEKFEVAIDLDNRTQLIEVGQGSVVGQCGQRERGHEKKRVHFFRLSAGPRHSQFPSCRGWRLPQNLQNGERRRLIINAPIIPMINPIAP